MKNNHKIIAFDQATHSTGFAVFDGDELVNFGTLKSASSCKDSIQRMEDMVGQIEKMVIDEQPEVIVFENIQFQSNAQTMKALARLQGMLIYCFYRLNSRYCIIEPSAWKGYCKIKGKKRPEQKANTIIFVKEKYGVDAQEDEADAIGIGTWAVNNIVFS